MSRGYFGIAMWNPKNSHNWGSLLRTAQVLDASYIASIGARYRHQASDTHHSGKHVPTFAFTSFDEFYSHMPKDCQLVGVEMGEAACDLSKFKHPQRAIYLLGAEDNGLPRDILNRCHHVVKLKGERSLNVSIAGSIVVYHREALKV